MNEDRCRNRFLVFMGKLNNASYHVTSFDGNDNYDFINVMHAYVDGLEPKVLGWIHNRIAMPVAYESFDLDQGYVEVINIKYPVVLEIVTYQVSLLKQFIFDHIEYQ